MKPFSLERLQEIVATKTAKVRFPTHDTEVTVRELTAAEALRVQKLIEGRDVASAEVNHDVELHVASIGIVDADYDFDSDEGRENLKQLPRAMIAAIASTIFGLGGVDGHVSKN
jgi:hypothetical protein